MAWSWRHRGRVVSKYTHMLLKSKGTVPNSADAADAAAAADDDDDDNDDGDEE